MFVGNICPSGSGSGLRIRIRIRIQGPHWIRIQSGYGSGRYLPITGAEDWEGGVEERPARPRGQALEHVMQHHVCQSAAKFPKSCYLKDKRIFSIFFFKMTYRFPAVLFLMRKLDEQDLFSVHWQIGTEHTCCFKIQHRRKQQLNLPNPVILKEAVDNKC